MSRNSDSRLVVNGQSLRLLVAVAALLALCVPLACRSAPRERESANQVCEGKELLAVRNETGDALDIYMMGEGKNLNLGTAGPGRTEFILPPRTAGGRGFQGRRPNGDVVFGSARRRQLTFEVECAKVADGHSD